MLIERFDNCEQHDSRSLKEGEVGTDGRTIYEELGELAKFVEATTRAIKDMEAPVATTTNQLPQANDFLAELSRMTEEGTHKVMGLTEAIEENRAAVTKKLMEVDSLLAKKDYGAARTHLTAATEQLGQDEARLLDISVALSFQDLVAQRVKKLVTILEDVQHKLLKLVVVFGLQQDQSKVHQEGRGHEMLKQLEASKKTSMNQGLVDDILGEFGFN